MVKVLFALAKYLTWWFIKPLVSGCCVANLTRMLQRSSFNQTHVLVASNSISLSFLEGRIYIITLLNPLPVIIILLNPLPVFVALKILQEILSFTQSFMLNTHPLVGCLENSDRKVKQFRVIPLIASSRLVYCLWIHCPNLNVSGSATWLPICIVKLSRNRHCVNWTAWLEWLLNLRPEHRTSTTAFHWTRFFALCFFSSHDIPKSSYSCWIVLLQGFFSLPFCLTPWGFHSRDRRVMLVAGFLKVWQIHRHFLLRMMTSILFCCVRCHSSSCEIFFGHHTLKMYQSLQLVKVWSWVMIFFVLLRDWLPLFQTLSSLLWQDQCHTLLVWCIITCQTRVKHRLSSCQMDPPSPYPSCFANSQNSEPESLHFLGNLV